MFRNHVSSKVLGRFCSFHSMAYFTTPPQQSLKFISIWPVDSLPRYIATRAGTGAEGGFLTVKAVWTKIMIFGRPHIRTQNVNGSSLQKEANDHTCGSYPSARINTTVPITHAATLLLELPLPNGNLLELKYKYVSLQNGKKWRVLFSAENPADLKRNTWEIYSNQE